MNIMTVDGYHAKIEYDEELDLFRGEILGLNGDADFYGKNPEDLRTDFKKSLQVFLEVCNERGIEPRKHFSGKFNLRIPPELHEQLAITAQAEGKSINMLAQKLCVSVWHLEPRGLGCVQPNMTRPPGHTTRPYQTALFLRGLGGFFYGGWGNAKTGVDLLQKR